MLDSFTEKHCLLCFPVYLYGNLQFTLLASMVGRLNTTFLFFKVNHSEKYYIFCKVATDERFKSSMTSQPSTDFFNRRPEAYDIRSL
jgi:hypothetical protein